jgi:hypothetical protein
MVRSKANRLIALVLTCMSLVGCDTGHHSEPDPAIDALTDIPAGKMICRIIQQDGGDTTLLEFTPFAVRYQQAFKLAQIDDEEAYNVRFLAYAMDTGKGEFYSTRIRYNNEIWYVRPHSSSSLSILMEDSSRHLASGSFFFWAHNAHADSILVEGGFKEVDYIKKEMNPRWRFAFRQMDSWGRVDGHRPGPWAWGLSDVGLTDTSNLLFFKFYGSSLEDGQMWGRHHDLKVWIYAPQVGRVDFAGPSRLTYSSHIEDPKRGSIEHFGFDAKPSDTLMITQYDPIARRVSGWMNIQGSRGSFENVQWSIVR